MIHNDTADGTAPMTGTTKPPQHGSLPPSGELGAFAWRVVITLLLLAVAYLFIRGIHVVLLTFAGILLAVALQSGSRWLGERTGWSHRISLAATVLALILLIGGLTWLFASTLIAQITELSQKLPELLRQARHQLQQYPWGQYILAQAPHAAESLAQGGDLSRVTGLASGASYFFEAVVVILIVGIFGAADPGVYKRGTLHLVPLRHRNRVSQALDETAGNLRGWLLGQILLMVMVGVTTTVALLLLGIPLALVLGLITGFMEIIPYIGAWIAFIPAALISLQMGTWYLAMTVGIYTGLHILEGYVVGPLVQRRAVHLPPALTLVAQILLGELFGLMGLLVAAPLTVAVIVFIKNLYVEDALGDPSMTHPEQAKARAAIGTSEERVQAGGARQPGG